MKAFDTSNTSVLLIGPYPPPFGGIASHLVTLIPGLLQRNVRDVAVIKFDVKDDVKMVDGGTVYSFTEKKHVWKLLLPWNWKFIFWALVYLAAARLGYKAILTEATKAYLIGCIAKRHGSNVFSYYQVDHSVSIIICSKIWRRTKAFVLTVFGEVYDEAGFFKKADKIIARILNSADALASSSCHCASGYTKFLNGRRVEPVYYGVDLDRFYTGRQAESVAFRKEMGVGDNDILLFFMGRFSPLMGLDKLLEAMPQIFENQKNIYFLIAGANGPLSDQVAVFQQKFADNVKVLSEVPFSLQPTLYGSADIVIAPSRDQHACMGMSIKEAMASAKVVIGSDAGGIPEAIVEGKTGYLVALDQSKNVDVQKLQQVIMELAKNESLRVSMGINARKRAEDIFSMDRTIDRMTEIFVSSLQKKKR